MKVLVTGADGFIGRELADQLLAEGLGGREVESLTLVDVRFGEQASVRGRAVRRILGSLTDAKVLASCMAETLDVVFHLASLPGGAAQRDYELGREVNLDATIKLLDALRAQPRPPRFVYASSVAVYGEVLPATVEEGRTLPVPVLSYGTHKLVCELLLADATRRSCVLGCALRLPGVVARPGDGAGLLSAFMSQVFWKLQANSPMTVPVSERGKAWWISARACAGNLRRAAVLAPEALQARTTYQMPALHLSTGDVVDALARRFGAGRRALVTYQPDKTIERLFASYPPLLTPFAEAAGFKHDGDVDGLVTSALNL